MTWDAHHSAPDYVILVLSLSSYTRLRMQAFLLNFELDVDSYISPLPTLNMRRH